ncbi:MAG: tetratricopeptide repeat protein [Comamonadaceae bacterium]|nr:MAG: tetratricopeptide repeat protein [Comamonadaceae bacterium]
MNAILNAPVRAPGSDAAALAQPALPPAVVPDYSDRLPEGQANSVYAAAYTLSQQGKHEQASTLFALLSMYRPREPKYTRSVAICFRKMGRYEDAIRYFAKTMELSQDSYEPAFQLVECMLLMGRREEAAGLLGKFCDMAAATGNDAVLAQAGGMLDLLYGRDPGSEPATGVDVQPAGSPSGYEPKEMTV